MKKLINLLSSLSLFSSLTTCVIACKSDKKDLSGLSDKLTITSLKNAKNFKEKLIDKIKTESGFENVSDTEVEILKKDGSALDDAHITGTIIEIKIKTKTDAKKTSGEKEIKVTWSITITKKNLSSLTNPTIQSDATASAFKTALITMLKTQAGFTTLEQTKLEIKKDASGSADVVLTDNATDDVYITGSTIKVHLSVKPAGNAEFEGTKMLTVNWTATTTKKNLSSLANPTIQSDATASAFKTALINMLKTQTGFNTLEQTKLEIKKVANGAAGTDLDNAYITGTTINVHLSVKPAGNNEFQGTKILTVNWTATTTKKNLSSLTNPTIQSDATASAFKTALITMLKTQTGFNTLEQTKLEIKKVANGAAGTDLDNAYITGATINVHLSVKPTGNAEFEGTKMLTVNWTATTTKKNLSSLTNPTIQSDATASAFKTALITMLKTQTGFNTLEQTKLEIKKVANGAAGTDLDNAYITGKTINVHLSVKPTGNAEFEGTKILTVNWTATTTKKNLSSLTNPTIQSDATASAFKTALINMLKTQTGFNTLEQTKLEIKKVANGAAGTDLDNAYITGKTINVHLSVKQAGNAEFEGTKMLSVNWTKSLLNLDALPGVVNVNATLSDVSDFKNELIDVLNYAEFKDLAVNKIKIEKYDGTTASILQPTDIATAGRVDIKISVDTPGNTEFEGTKNITVNLTEKNSQELDLDGLPNTINVDNVTNNDLEDFKAELVEALKTNNANFTNLNVDKIKIERHYSRFNPTRLLSSTTLTDNDIVTSSINVKISVDTSGTSQFKGIKVITVNLTTI